jgi:hypothetical protein
MRFQNIKLRWATLYLGCSAVAMFNMVGVVLSAVMMLSDAHPLVWIIAIYMSLFSVGGLFAAVNSMIRQPLGSIVVTSLYLGYYVYCAVGFETLPSGREVHDWSANIFGVVAGVSASFLFYVCVAPLVRSSTAGDAVKLAVGGR